jgi:glycosyltransferase involved in cell wall biosynthesis
MHYIIYLGSLILLILGFSVFRNFLVRNPQKNTFSILIACRNEEQNLPVLFESLRNLNYPKVLYEIIIVDDASSDQSPHLLKQFAENSENIKCFYLLEKNEKYKGKKAALKKAAQNAMNEFLLFTDADCIVHPEWLNGYNKFISPQTSMICGFYSEQNVSSFKRFSNQFSAAIFSVSIALGIPFSAAGSNLCIRKTVFENVDGYEKIKHHTAGDDKLLVQMIHKAGYKIAFNHFNHISTSSQISNSYFKRKYGKAKLSPPFIQLLSFLVLLFYLSIPFFVLFRSLWIPFLCYYTAINFFWFSILIRHKFKWKIMDLFYLLIYPYFVIFYTIWGMLSSWQWKDQKAKS